VEHWCVVLVSVDSTLCCLLFERFWFSFVSNNYWIV